MNDQARHDQWHGHTFQPVDIDARLTAIKCSNGWKTVDQVGVFLRELRRKIEERQILL